MQLALTPAAFIYRDSAESDRKRKRAPEDRSKMGEGENKREEGTIKDGDGREPEAKKKKQSKDDTSSDSDDEDEDDDEEASVQMCDAAAVCNKEESVQLALSFNPRKPKAERYTQKWTKRCAGSESTYSIFDALATTAVQKHQPELLDVYIFSVKIKMMGRKMMRGPASRRKVSIQFRNAAEMSL